MNPVLFLHIPRTGGIAYRQKLKQAFRQDEIREEPTAVQGRTLKQWQDEFVYDPQHKFIAGHWGWEIVERIPDVRVVTILRNPVDRAISDFQHHLRENGSSVWNEEVYGITDFFEFIKYTQGYTRMSNAHIRQLCGSAWGQSDRELPDNALELAKQHIDECFWVNFTESPFRMLPNRKNHELWWGKSDAGRKVNITPSHTRPLDDEVIDCIIEMNALDAQLYKYALQAYGTRKYELL
jgi:hypothetical protein